MHAAASASRGKCMTLVGRPLCKVECRKVASQKLQFEQNACFAAAPAVSPTLGCIMQQMAALWCTVYHMRYGMCVIVVLLPPCQPGGQLEAIERAGMMTGFVHESSAL